MEYQGFRSLKVYHLAYQLALEIFNDTKSFPKEERYDLVATQTVIEIGPSESRRSVEEETLPEGVRSASDG